MIRNLRIRNFKCFEAEEIRLGPLTVLAGANATGKSSVFQALLLLRQSYLQRLLPERGLALNGELVQIGTGKDAINENFSPSLGDRLELALVLEDGQEVIWICEQDTDDSEVLLRVKTEIPDRYDFSLFTNNFQYLGADRLVPQPIFEMADDAVRNRRQIGSKGQYTVHFLAVHGRERIPCPKLVNPKARSEQIQAQVEAWLESLIPGVRLVIKEFREIDLVRLQFQFTQGRDTSNPYRPTNVGFGITYVLPILVAVVSAKPGTLLLIENPEAHLHPRSQSLIGAMLAQAASAGIQILIETHSDHVLNGIRLAVRSGMISPQQVCLHFFERRVIENRSHHTVVSPQIDPDGRIDHWPEGFFDEWDRALDALLAKSPEVT